VSPNVKTLSALKYILQQERASRESFDELKKPTLFLELDIRSLSFPIYNLLHNSDGSSCIIGFKRTTAKRWIIG
jgi:hypothetical protein